MNSLFHSIIIIILIATQSILCHSNSRIWSDLQECRVCDGRHVDALFIVDVTKSTASKGSYVRAISQYIEYRVDELDMISFDKQTDLSLNHALYGRSAVIVDDTVLFNLDGFPVFDTFQENLQGSNSLQIKSQLELASLSVFPLVNDTTELLVYYLSDRFPILSDDEQLPCDENNVPLVDPLRGDYFFVSLNDNLEGVEYLSSCLNVYPHHDHDNVFETEQQYAFLNEFQTQKVGGSRVVTIEGEGTEDTIYSHVCGIDCCHVNSTWYPRFPYHDNITAPTLYDEDQDRTLSELDILFTTDDDMAINQVFIEEVSILLFATAYTMFMDARLYLKVMDGSTVTWLSLTPNAPATYGDPESNAFKLLLYEEYDDLVTLIPGRDYKIEVRFFGTNAAARYMSIPDDPSKTDDECQSRLDCDLEGYFTEIEFQAMYGLNTIESLDDSVAMYMNFGCLFEPRDASKPITTTPSPEPICAGIQTPGNYGKCNGDTQTPEDMDWDFKFYGARYDAVLDITELTYAIMVQYNSIENVVEIRLQLPCDCLMDNCMLSALLYDSNPEVEVEDGMFVWSIEVENSRTYILNLELRGRLDQSISDNGQYALYGKRKTCAYGGNIEVPQPCRCWGDWQQISDTCDDPSCGMGQQVDQRYCDTECAFGGYEYYGKCNKYDYDVTDMSQWEHGCFGGDTTETTCDRGCCDCDDWDTWSEWGDCEYNSVYKKIYKTRIRTCNTVESDTVYLCDGQAVDMEAEVCEVPTSSPITSTPTTTVITTDTTQGATPTPLAPDLDTTELPQTTSEEITTSSVTEDVGTTAQPPQTTTETSLETTAEPIETTATPTDGTDAPQTTPSDEVTTTDTSVPDTTSLETTDVTEVSDLPITPEPQTTAVIITTKSEDIITTTEEIATTGVPTDTPQTTTGDVITTTESSVSDTLSPETTSDGTVDTTIETPQTTPTVTDEETTTTTSSQTTPDGSTIAPTDEEITTSLTPQTTSSDGVITTTEQVVPETTEQDATTTTLGPAVVTTAPPTQEPLHLQLKIYPLLHKLQPMGRLISTTPQTPTDGATTVEPIVTTTEPVDTTQGDSTTAEPIVSTTEPVDTTQGDITTAEPIVTTAQPVDTTQADSTTAEPIVTTTKPVDTTQADATTAEPIVSTAEPSLSTTTATTSNHICEEMLDHGYYYEFIVLYDNSCGLNDDDCNELLDGIAELIRSLVDEGDTKSKVQTMEFNADGTTRVVVGFHDDVYQTDVSQYADYIQTEGHCKSGGQGTTQIVPAINDAISYFDQQDAIKKVITVSTCADTTGADLHDENCNSNLKKALDTAHIDHYAINIAEKGSASNQLSWATVLDNLECLSEDRVCITPGTIDAVEIECLLPHICIPSTEHPPTTQPSTSVTSAPTEATDTTTATPTEVTTTDTGVPDTTSVDTTDVTEVSDLPITPEPQTTAVIITTKSEDIITTTQDIVTTGQPTDTPQTTTEDVITTTESSVSDTVSPDTTQDGTVETTIAPGTTDVPETTTEDVVTTLEPDTTGVEPQTTVEVDTTISAPDTTVMDTTTELPGTTVESTGTPQTTPQVDVTTTETIIPDTTTAIETTDATSAPTGDVVTTPTPTEEEITTTTVQDETTITPTDDTPQTTSSDGVITTTEQVAPETTEDVSPISTTNAPITTGTPTIGPTPFCDYKVDGPHQLGDGSKIGDVLVRSNMEISFDLTLSSSCTGTSCHILRIGHANSQERVPLIEILDGTNAIRMAYSDAQHSNSGHSIDHADVKAAVVDGQKHHYYFKFHPTQRIFELDNVRYLDESDGPYDTSSYDGQTYPMYAVDDIEFGQSLVDAVIENICVISRDLVELPTVTTTTAPTNNPTTTTTDAPITLSPSTTSVPPSTTEQECQYELVPQVLNWWTAEAYCQSQFEDNGHLMSIHNLKEAKLAHKLCDTEAINPGLGALPILQNDTNCCCWIGLNDYVTEGVFLWSDDSENDYENWYGDGREGELIADEEDCAVVTDWTNKWFDRSCLSSSHIGGFICQYGCDKAPKTTTTGLPTTTETIAPTDDVITTQETTAIETTVEDIVTTDADTTATPQTTQEVVDTTAVPPDTTDTPQTTVEDVITTRSDVPQTTAEEESTTTTDVPGTTVEDIVTTGVTPTDVPETTAEDIATTLEPDTTGVEPTDTT
eukprot:999475_1